MQRFCFVSVALSMLASSFPFASQAPAPTAAESFAPAVAPDGSRIAFVSVRAGVTDLFTVLPDGSDERQLTHSPDEESRPEWSADGARLFFSVVAGDTSRVLAIDADGSHQQTLATVAGRGVDVAPDGRRYVYWTGSWTSNTLFLATVDGGAPRMLSDGATTTVAWNARVSPDGTQVAFTGRDVPNGLQVFLVGSDGSRLRQFTHVTPAEGRAQVPAWSADGRQLAFQVNGDHTSHIWVADVASGAARKLAAHAERYADEVPSWFPDGTRLAFQSNRAGGMEIWVMNADGNGSRQVTH